MRRLGDLRRWRTTAADLRLLLSVLPLWPQYAPALTDGATVTDQTADAKPMYMSDCATVTLLGTYRRLDGTPETGTVLVIPSVRTVSAVGGPILAGRLSVVLDDVGHFAVDLPATDDDTLTPTGFEDDVEPKLRHGHLAPVTVDARGRRCRRHVRRLVSRVELDPAAQQRWSHGWSLQNVSSTGGDPG